MRPNTRKTSLSPPGAAGLARVGRDPASLLPRLQPGDVAVIDHVDLDRDTATAMVDAGVRAVVNAAPMISGRYASHGPELLAEAGVTVVDQVGSEGLTRIRDAQQVRVHAGVVYAVRPDGRHVELASGRAVDLDQVHRDREQASRDLRGQVDALARSTGDFLHSEQGLLLKGYGLPALQTRLDGRPVVVVARADHAGLHAIGGFVRDQAPVVIAVGAAADDLLGLSWVPDVLVLTAGQPETMPSVDALRIATDVVLMAPRGSSLAEQATVEAVATSAPHLVDSSATAEDVALLLADHHGAALVVGVGLQARLDEFLDGQVGRRASSFLTRLKLGDRLVDADAVRTLYTGRPGAGQVALVVVSGLVALVAAIAVTPVGQDWADGIADYLRGLT